MVTRWWIESLLPPRRRLDQFAPHISTAQAIRAFSAAIAMTASSGSKTDLVHQAVGAVDDFRLAVLPSRLSDKATAGAERSRASTETVLSRLFATRVFT